MVCVCVQGIGGRWVSCSITQAGAVGFGPKSETEPLRLGFRRTNGNGAGDRWGEVVRACVQGLGGRWVSCSITQAGSAGFGPKSETDPLRLDFGHANGNSGGDRWGEIVEGWE